MQRKVPESIYLALFGLQQNEELVTKLTEENFLIIQGLIGSFCDISMHDLEREDILKKVITFSKQLESPMFGAEYNRLISLLNFLIEKIKLNIPFANEGLLEIYSILLSNRDLYKIHPMHVAAKYGNANSLKQLIEKKADVNILDDKGKSPLYHAVLFNTSDAVKCLIEHKADIHSPSNRTLLSDLLILGPSPLNARVDKLAVLLENKADPNGTFVNTNGSVVPHITFATATSPLLRLLIDYKADIHSTKKIAARQIESLHKDFSYLPRENTHNQEREENRALLEECAQEDESGYAAEIAYSFLYEFLKAYIRPRDLIKIIIHYMSVELAVMEQFLTTAKKDPSISIDTAKILGLFKSQHAKDQLSKCINMKETNDKKSAPASNSQNDGNISQADNSVPRSSGTVSDTKPVPATNNNRNDNRITSQTMPNPVTPRSRPQEECIMQEPPRRSYKKR